MREKAQADKQKADAKKAAAAEKAEKKQGKENSGGKEGDATDAGAATSEAKDGAGDAATKEAKNKDGGDAATKEAKNKDGRVETSRPTAAVVEQKASERGQTRQERVAESQAAAQKTGIVEEEML